MDEDAIEELAGELPRDFSTEKMDFEPVPDEYQPVVRAAMDYAKLVDELEALAEEWEAVEARDPFEEAIKEQRQAGKIQAAKELREVLQQYE